MLSKFSEVCLSAYNVKTRGPNFDNQQLMILVRVYTTKHYFCVQYCSLGNILKIKIHFFN